MAPPATGADLLFDRRLADPLLAAEPLYLMMAGLVAARHGLATLLSLGRLDLALDLACWERDRLTKLAGDHGVNEKLLLHLVACATLCRGHERAGLQALIDEERAALPYERGVERDALAEALETALPAQAEDGVLRSVVSSPTSSARPSACSSLRNQPRPRREGADRPLS